MMNAIWAELCEKTQSLATLLKESKEYQQYLKARENLKSQEELAVLLSEFRRKQLNLQVAHIMGQDVAEEDAQVNELYQNLSKSPLVNDFLNAEYCLVRLIETMRDSFGKELELGSDFILPDRTMN